MSVETADNLITPVFFQNKKVVCPKCRQPKQHLTTIRNIIDTMKKKTKPNERDDYVKMFECDDPFHYFFVRFKGPSQDSMPASPDLETQEVIRQLKEETGLPDYIFWNKQVQIEKQLSGESVEIERKRLEYFRDVFLKPHLDYDLLENEGRGIEKDGHVDISA